MALHSAIVHGWCTSSPKCSKRLATRIMTLMSAPPEAALAAILTFFSKMSWWFQPGPPIHGHIAKHKDRSTENPWRGAPHAALALPVRLAHRISQAGEPSANWLIQTTGRLQQDRVTLR